MRQTILICLFAFFISLNVHAQQPFETTDWVVEMMSETPNAWRVDQLYKAYYKRHPFSKNYYTQYYKRWRRTVQDRLDENGYVVTARAEYLLREDADYLSRFSALQRSAGSWSHVGANQVWNGNVEKHNDQTNVYSIDVCQSTPWVMYAGTEPGEIYKSADGGLNWNCVSLSINMNGGVNAVAVDPTNSNVVLAGNGNVLKRSNNGGGTWTDVPGGAGIDVREILFNPNNPQIVHFVCEAGLYRSTDGGQTITRTLQQSCWDIKYQPGTDNLYLLRSNNSAKICEFWISPDDGTTWAISNTGWYQSSDPARSIGGGRIGVSPADPNRVYAYLIGDSKTGDIGFIGLFRSNNAGLSWTLPNGPTGGPYTTAHPNLAYGWPGWDYHQGYYNCAIMVSKTNADSILIGGLNMWRSNDGALTFSPVGGYQGNTFSLHPDMQDFKETSIGTWATTDGGIYFSNDFFTTHEEERSTGIRGTDFWGFGQGWNTDIFGGGAYHNGNNVRHENYPPNQMLQLGGGEASTGYANPSSSNRMYFSDLGGRVIPDTIGPNDNFGFGLFPNESYGAAESSEIEFHPASFNNLFLGKDNKLWKSTDGGSSFALLKAFGTDSTAFVQHIEIPFNNPNIMYVSQRPSTGNTGLLWKSTDAGNSWNTLPLPTLTAGTRNRILLSCDLANDRILYLAFPSGGNNSKVYKSIDGGSSWTNMTTATLNGESIHGINLISGTDGGVYLFTSRTVYYRNNSMTDWALDNVGLPAFIDCNIARPFYRDEKIRVASYGKSIWESALYDRLSSVISQPMADKLSYKLWCDETQSATFQFECHSVLNHAGASWSWSFQDGTPATSSLRNPSVFFTGAGSKLVVLTITDAQGHTDTDSMYVDVQLFSADSIVREDFERGLTQEWRIFNPDNATTWGITNSEGGYGLSSSSAVLDNYYYNGSGQTDDMVTNIDLTGLAEAQMTFDVAYAPYDANLFDRLQVLVSTDCGVNYTVLYDKSNTILATAPTQASYFSPTSAQWRTDTVDLSAYLGQSGLAIAFRNINGYGNPIYLDNINLRAEPTAINVKPAPSSESFAIYPNPVTADRNMRVTSSEGGLLKITFYDAKGRAVWFMQANSNASIQIPSVLSSGSYTVVVESERTMSAKKVIVLD